MTGIVVVNLVSAYLAGLLVGYIIFTAKDEANRSSSEMGLFLLGAITLVSFIFTAVAGLRLAPLNGLFTFTGLCVGHYINRKRDGS